MSSEFDYAWAAGFFDGEACFYAKKEATRVIPMICVQQVSMLPIYKLMDMFGGHVSMTTKKIGRPINQWRVNGAGKVASTIEAVLPHLVFKRDQAEVLLALCKTFDATNNRPLSPEVLELRLSFADDLKLLKRMS